MCGISGIINKSNEQVSRESLTSMNNLVKHRGPDAEGYYYKDNIGFGHRRLSILDLSELGNQPMHYSDYTITYNGEIYNYLEIREELINKGHTFISDTDTEVILAAYMEWGTQCVNHFNGMWAFAIHDKKNEIVFLSRDRFGIKPLYYLESTNCFYFGSEIKQLLFFTPNRKVNKQVLFDYLYLSYHHHTNETFFEGIKSLEQSHNLVYSLRKNTYSIEKYYDLNAKTSQNNLSFNNAINSYKNLITNSINFRLRSDVKVGTCLSGGMDSSFIAAVAAPIYEKNSGEKFTAVTAKSIEKKTDESHYAKMVADMYDLNWDTTKPSKDDFLKYVEDVIEIQEEPFGSPSIVMQYFVMQKAKENGCIVMLDGQGGDETLLGYDRYYATFINEKKGLFNKIKGFVEISKNSKLSLKDALLYNLYFSNKFIRRSRQLRRNRFYKKPFKKYFNSRLLGEITKNNSSINRLQVSEITKTQLQKLLKYEDRNSMAVSIETRVPFIDHNVVEMAVSLPFEYKMTKGWSKYILRHASENILPNEIVWRKNKFGFEAPKDVWLSETSFFLDKVIESPFMENFVDFDKLNKNKLGKDTLWKLYNVAIWADKFKVTF